MEEEKHFIIQALEHRFLCLWNMTFTSAPYIFPALDGMGRLNWFGVRYIPSSILKARRRQFSILLSSNLVTVW